MKNDSISYNETKQDIFDAAKSLFYEKGYYNTSIGDISETAHVNRALISYYFGSKGHLALQVVNQFNTTISEKINHYLFLTDRVLNPLVLFAVETRAFNSFRRLNGNYKRFMKEICLENILSLGEDWIVKTVRANDIYEYIEQTYDIKLDIVERQIYQNSLSSIINGLIITHSRGYIDCSHEYIAEKECEMYLRIVGLEKSEIDIILQKSKSVYDNMGIEMKKNFNIEI